MRFRPCLLLTCGLLFWVPSLGFAQQSMSIPQAGAGATGLEWTAVPPAAQFESFGGQQIQMRIHDEQPPSILGNIAVGAAVGLVAGFMAGWAADAVLQPGLSDLEFAYLYRVTGAGLGLVIGGVTGGVLHSSRQESAASSSS
jgi:hypothetical protein